MGAMRIIVSDYAGHAFPVQLARELAARGHEVLHISSASFQTPKGKVGRDEADPKSFASVQVRTREPFAKASFVKRRRQEIEIGHRIADHVAGFAPDIVLSIAPPDVQKHVQRAALACDARFIFWVQDLYANAMLKILPRKFGPLGTIVGRVYERLEARMLRRSDHIIVISADFAGEVEALAGQVGKRLSVIENWAPLDHMPLFPRDNDWAQARLAPTGLRVIYSGTLGYKHNPGLLLKLARSLKGEVLVFSEGEAAAELAQDARAEGLSNLKVSGWLPFEELPQALASADMLVVVLEADAGVFSVPSKVLSYMCAGRAILGSIPLDNLAARLIVGDEAGVVADPADPDGFVAAALALAGNPELRQAMGANARSYAERTFAIDRIADRFEAIFRA